MVGAEDVLIMRRISREYFVIVWNLIDDPRFSENDEWGSGSGYHPRVGAGLKRRGFLGGGGWLVSSLWFRVGVVLRATSNLC
jgi:hypothetical protein